MHACRPTKFLFPGNIAKRLDQAIRRGQLRTQKIGKCRQRRSARLHLVSLCDAEMGGGERVRRQKGTVPTPSLSLHGTQCYCSGSGLQRSERWMLTMSDTLQDLAQVNGPTFCTVDGTWLDVLLHLQK